MVNGKRIAKVNDRKEQRHKFPERHDQRDGQRGAFGGQNVDGTNADVLGDHVSEQVQPLAGNGETDEGYDDRKTGVGDLDVLPDVVVEKEESGQGKQVLHTQNKKISFKTNAYNVVHFECLL